MNGDFATFGGDGINFTAVARRQDDRLAQAVVVVEIFQPATKCLLADGKLFANFNRCRRVIKSQNFQVQFNRSSRSKFFMQTRQKIFVTFMLCR